MKHTFFLGTIILLFANSCASNENKKETHNQTAATTPVAEKPFKDVVFDSKYDLSCEMPVSAGVSDTSHYKGKIYGFCSKECKQDFEKNKEALLAKSIK